MRENGESLHSMSGVPFLNWRRRHAAAVGAVLLDDLPEPLAQEIVAYLTQVATDPNVVAA